jgi:hypothetical protein
MNASKIPALLITLALSCGTGMTALAQGPPPPPYGDQDRDHDRDHDRDRRENPGLRMGFHDGFDNGRRDRDSHHRFNPERAYHHNGRPEYRSEFGPRDDFRRAYHDGWLRGYDRGYNGGDADYDRH